MYDSVIDSVKGFLEDSLYTFAMRSLYSYYTHGLGLPYMRYTRTDPMLLLYTIVYR